MAAFNYFNPECGNVPMVANVRFRDKALNKVLFVGLLTLLGMLISSAQAAAEPLKLCQESTAEDPFLNRFEIAGKTYFGFHAATVAHALNNLHIRFSIWRLPWRGCMAETKRGAFDAVIGIGWSDERRQHFIFPLSEDSGIDESYRLYSERYPIYVTSQSELVWDGVKFTNIRFGIAAPRGFIVEKKLKRLGVLQELDSGVEIGLSLLEKGRVDGVVLSEEAGDRLLQEQLYRNIKKLQPLFFTQPLFLAFSQHQKKLTTRQIHEIWDEVRRVREKRRYKGNQSGSDKLKTGK